MENTDFINEQSVDKGEVEIDILELLEMLLHKWIIIAVSGVGMAVIAFIFFKFIVTPQYTSTARIMVINRQNNETITATDLTSSTTLSNDYVEIVTSRSVLEKVIEELELNYDVSTLKSKVSASVVTNTRMINISVTDPDPVLARQMTDSISTITSNRICEVMHIENMVSIVDMGSLPTSPSSPATLRNTVIAAFLGIIVSSAVIIVIGILDDRIKTQEDVEKYLGVSVLGAIPNFEEHLVKEREKDTGKESDTV